MDNKTSEKLDKFTKIVMDDAEKMRDEFLAGMDEEKAAVLKRKETEFLEEAYKKIQDSVNQSRRKDREMVLQAETEARHELLLLRERIIREVFTEVNDRLRAFRKTEQYREWLIRKTKKALAEAGSGDCVIWAAPEDVDFIKAEFAGGQVTVEEETDKHFGGGVVVMNTDHHIAVDYSFRTLLADQKKDFLSHSGLSVD